MRDLYPLTITQLVKRLYLESEGNELSQIFGFSRRFWWIPGEFEGDISIRHFGKKLHTPIGPAAGPHTQMAQNIVFSWLAGSRFIELKTVQILDELEIPRPCIYAPNVGYNAEWSQELRIEESIREYAKAWILVHAIQQKNRELWPEFATSFDISVGYDLAGIKSQKMKKFFQAMLNSSSVIEELLSELPENLREYLDDVEIPPQIADSATISTFHGCPADEIEAIAEHLMREYKLHTVIKLNPTLLGFERADRILREKLKYSHLTLSPEAFEKDLQWPQLMEMIPRLQAVAREVGVGFGVKFSNTLVVESQEPPFPRGVERYLSGPPLHVLAVTLASEFAEATGGSVPITFSAGIDAENFPHLAATFLSPITVCTDLLKPKGYGRLKTYFKNLYREMKKFGASNIDEYRQAVAQTDDPKKAALKNLKEWAEKALIDEKYSAPKNSKKPPSVDSQLKLFDCLNCNKCIPVCPNGAIFSFHSVSGNQPFPQKSAQIGIIADLCNLCGNCDTWCPERGGPYRDKPNFFLKEESYSQHPERKGFFFRSEKTLLWRVEPQKEWKLSEREGKLEVTTPTGETVLLELSGQNATEIDSLAELLSKFPEGERTSAADLLTVWASYKREGETFSWVATAASQK